MRAKKKTVNKVLHGYHLYYLQSFQTIITLSHLEPRLIKNKFKGNCVELSTKSTEKVSKKDFQPKTFPETDPCFIVGVTAVYQHVSGSD